MSTPFVGQVSTVAFQFAPVNWAKCQGQSVSIAQNPTLFQLIGTTYGGDGVNTYNLPNLQSRMPIHQGQGLGLSNYVIGQLAGTETVTLNSSTMAQHTHPPFANSKPATTQTPSNATILSTGVDGSGETPAQIPKIYIPSSSSTATVNMAAQSIGNAGGSTPISILQPYLAINFVIALFGVFPTQN